MENPKYKDVDQMLVLLRETFGYDRDLKSLVRSHLIERNIQIAKQQAEAKRLMAS